MTSLRIFFVGGLISFRALFNWLSPWIYIPSMLVAPIFQILLFAYMGRNAGVESDAFFVIGNAVQYSAIPCLFAMANTIAGERWTQTLGIVLVTPANGCRCSSAGRCRSWSTGSSCRCSAWSSARCCSASPSRRRPGCPLALVVAVAAVSCTGLGLVNAALGLRVRETAVMSNVLFGVLLIFCGVNVARRLAARLDGGGGLAGCRSPMRSRQRASWRPVAPSGRSPGWSAPRSPWAWRTARSGSPHSGCSRSRAAGTRPWRSSDAQRPWFATALIASAAASGSRYSPPFCVGCRCSSSR